MPAKYISLIREGTDIVNILEHISRITFFEAPHPALVQCVSGEQCRHVLVVLCICLIVKHTPSFLFKTQTPCAGARAMKHERPFRVTRRWHNSDMDVLSSHLCCFLYWKSGQSLDCILSSHNYYNFTHMLIVLLILQIFHHFWHFPRCIFVFVGE